MTQDLKKVRELVKWISRREVSRQGAARAKALRWSIPGMFEKWQGGCVAGAK
jgi:hypothetical protein